MIILVFLILTANSIFHPNSPEQVVSDFYSWYIDGGYREMKPTFKELKNGMTDLDFSLFDEAHQRFKFHEDLVERSRKIYRRCRDNLSRIPYDEFILRHDLDYDESINCDFQFWQWFGLGMEPYEHFEITETKRLSEDSYEITVGLAWRKEEQLTRLIPVTVKRIDGIWEITNIGVKWK